MKIEIHWREWERKIIQINSIHQGMLLRKFSFLGKTYTIYGVLCNEVKYLTPQPSSHHLPSPHNSIQLYPDNPPSPLLNAKNVPEFLLSPPLLFFHTSIPPPLSNNIPWRDNWELQKWRQYIYSFQRCRLQNPQGRLVVGGGGG